MVRKAVLSGKINELNACHKVAIFLAEKDNEITKKDKAKIIDTLTENYSIEFQQLMNISERTLNSSLYITLVKVVLSVLLIVKEKYVILHM